MRSVLSRPRLCALAAAAAGAGLLVAAADWPQPSRSVEVTFLLLIAIFGSAGSAQWPVGPFGATMRPPFVVAFLALLLHGPMFGLAVATASALAQLLASRAGNEWRREAVSRAAIPIGAIGAAGAAYLLVGAWTAHLDWPWQAMPLGLASAIAAYCLVAGVGAGLIVPAVTGQPVDSVWLARTVASVPPHVMGATIAAALAELIGRELWAALPAVFVPLAFCWEGYRGYLYRLEEER